MGRLWRSEIARLVVVAAARELIFPEAFLNKVCGRSRCKAVLQVELFDNNLLQVMARF